MTRLRIAVVLFFAGILLIGIVGNSKMHKSSYERVLRTFASIHGDPISNQLAPRAYLIDSQAGKLHIVNISKGVSVESLPLGFEGSFTPADIDLQTNHIFVAQPSISGRRATAARVTMLTADTGRVLRVIRLPINAELQQIQVDSRTSRVMVLASYALKPFNGVFVCVLTSNTGQIIRCSNVNRSHDTFSEGEPYTLAIDQHSGHAFLADAITRRVYMLDGVSGRVLRSQPLAFPPGFPRIDTYSNRVFISSITGNEVSTIDTSNGRLLRTVTIQARRQLIDGLNTPVVAKDRIFVCTFGSNVIGMINPHTGRLLHVIHLAGNPMVAFADDRTNRVFVATSRNEFAILDKNSGRLISKVTVGQTVNVEAIAVNHHTGRVFVADIGRIDQTGSPVGKGAVYVLDGYTGATIMTIPVGVLPNSIVLDEYSNRALVVNEGGQVHYMASNTWSWIPLWLRQHLPFTCRSQTRTRTVAASVTVIDTQ